MTPAASGPSPRETRLQAELDRLRREHVKLKKAQGAPDAKAVGALEARVEELVAARQRLSKLYFGQVDENRKRSRRLHLVLEAIGRINTDLDLDSILERLAGGIHASLDFRKVLVRLRDPGTDRLRARASVGIDDDGRRRLAGVDLAAGDLEGWLREEFRVGRSYFVRRAAGPGGDPPAGDDAGADTREAWEWKEGDAVLVTLLDRAGGLLGLVSAEDPADRLVPSLETVELLEVFANHAAIAIENATLMREMERRGQEFERANQRMREAQALKSTFQSTVSHELRTPLAAIRAYVDTLLNTREGEMSHAQRLHFLSIVDEESARLQRLIESVLDLNRHDAGVQRPERQRVDLAAVVDEVIHQLWPMAEAGQVSLKEAAEHADTGMEADRDQIRQLLLHLGSNGIKFTPPGGSVTFRILGDAGELVLQVEDTGVGIPKESIDRVFERFYQVDSSLARRFGGTGLGLAICKSIVEGHGGRIEVESEPGRGSTFRVTIPRRSAARVMLRLAPERSAAIDEVLRLAIEKVADIMDARVVSLLAPGADGSLAIEAATGLDELVVRETRIPIGQGVAGWVYGQRRPACVRRGDPRVDVEGSGRPHYRSGTFLSVPLEGRRGLLGVLNVTDPASAKPFRAEDCHLLLHLAHRIGEAWEQAQAGEAGAGRAIRILHEAEGHDPAETAARRVDRSRTLARALGAGEAEAGAISYAASLDPEGSGTGRDEAAPADHGQVSGILLSLEEWWDGSGYPHGLSGESIPLGARILAAVHVWEDLEADSPRDPGAVRTRLRGLAGVRLDPRVVNQIERALQELAQRDAPPAAREAATAAQGGES